jgi:hypothetical protein
MGFVYIVDDPEEGASDRRDKWKELVEKVQAPVQVNEWRRGYCAVEDACRQWLNNLRDERCVALIHAPDWEDLSDQNANNTLERLTSEHTNCLFVLYTGGDWQCVPWITAPNFLRIGCSVERARNIFIRDRAVKAAVIDRVCQWLENRV